MPAFLQSLILPTVPEFIMTKNKLSSILVASLLAATQLTVQAQTAAGAGAAATAGAAGAAGAAATYGPGSAQAGVATGGVVGLPVALAVL